MPERYDWTEIRAYYEAGHTLAECKERFGFSNNSWQKAVATGKVVPRPDRTGRRTHETREAVAKLLSEGLTHSEVAYRLGLSKPTVSYHARKLGVPLDERAARRYDWRAIQEAHDAGLSARECQGRFGFSSSAWYDAVERGLIIARSSVTPLEELLVAGRPRNRGHLRRRLLKAGLKDERCERCGLSEWHGEPLRITLHHVNGDGYDSRLANIEFLCPNCHSQTPNYAGRNGHLRPR